MAKKKTETPDFESVDTHDEEHNTETSKGKNNPDSNDIDESINNDPLLSGPTVKRDYSNVQVDEKLADDMPHIPPPDFGNNRYDPNQDESAHQEAAHAESPGGEPSNQGASGSHHSDERSSQNFEPGDTHLPGMEDLSNKEKKKNAEQLADLTIYVYEQMHEVGRNFGKVTDMKLTRKAAKGDFDFSFINIPIPLSEHDQNEVITLREFFNTINHIIDENIVVTEEFKERVKPLLLEFFVSKGWGMTPENSLLMTVLMDLAPKITTLVQLKRSTNQMIETAAAYYQRMQNGQQQESRDTSPPPPPPRGEQNRSQKQENTESSKKQKSETAYDVLQRMEKEDVGEPEEMVNHE